MKYINGELVVSIDELREICEKAEREAERYGMDNELHIRCVNDRHEIVQHGKDGKTHNYTYVAELKDIGFDEEPSADNDENRIYAIFTRTNRRVQWRYAEYHGRWESVRRAIEEAKKDHHGENFEYLVQTLGGEEVEKGEYKDLSELM